MPPDMVVVPVELPELVMVPVLLTAVVEIVIPPVLLVLSVRLKAPIIPPEKVQSPEPVDVNVFKLLFSVT